MKRCPQCNRLESDDALTFCRADGTALVNESGSIPSLCGQRFLIGTLIDDSTSPPPTVLVNWTALVKK